MTVRDLYQFSVERGIEMDPRGPEALQQHLAAVRAEYEAVEGNARLGFDTERLRNPFGDTRVVCGDPEAEVKRIICGVDIGGAEIAMADALRHHGRPVDLIFAHHATAPGGGMGSKYDIMWAQVQMLTDFGVPAQKAEKLIRAQIGGEQRSLGYNLNQLADALGLPLVTIHGPADLYLFQEGRRILMEDQPQRVGDLIDICDAWPEVRWMIERGKGTEAAVGDPRDPLGPVYYVFFGGWNPTPAIFEAVCEAGCGTLWVVATSEELNAIARKHGVSVVVVPHYPADNYGINHLLDAAMDRFGDFDVVDCGGFVRHDRRKGR
jgi:hypothetical protein